MATTIRVTSSTTVLTTDTTAYPAYTTKQAILEDLLDAMGQGPNSVFVIAKRLGETDVTALSDKGSTLV